MIKHIKKTRKKSVKKMWKRKRKKKLFWTNISSTNPVNSTYHGTVKEIGKEAWQYAITIIFMCVYTGILIIHLKISCRVMIFSRFFHIFLCVLSVLRLIFYFNMPINTFAYKHTKQNKKTRKNKAKKTKNSLAISER